MNNAHVAKIKEDLDKINAEKEESAAVGSELSKTTSVLTMKTKV